MRITVYSITVDEERVSGLVCAAVTQIRRHSCFSLRVNLYASSLCATEMTSSQQFTQNS